MKTLKFKDYLIPQILDGSKTTTWRLLDDKNLRTGDQLSFINADTGTEFAHAEIIDVTEQEMKDIDPATYQKTYTSLDKMIEHYRKFYGDQIDGHSIVKILTFRLISRAF